MNAKKKTDEYVKTHKFGHGQHVKFTCKTCRKCFERDFKLFSDDDKFCDHCKSPWVMPGITHQV